MDERSFYSAILYGWAGVALAVFPLLFFVSAPYGRHSRGGWGPRIGARLGWIVMEAPSPILFTLFFLWGGWRPGFIPNVFLALWLVHYVNRAFIFPFRIRGGGRTMTLLTVAFGFIFNLVNAYIGGRHFSGLGPAYPEGWVLDPRFVGGTAIFAAGLAVNLHSDAILRSLRGKGGAGDTGYSIPRGGLFRFVTSPNYLGEMIEWTGWAIATWSLPGLLFALWTIANLLPRALSHHAWYHRTFKDYPRERKAIVPFIL